MRNPGNIVSIVSAGLVLAGLIAWLAGAFQDRIPPGITDRPAARPPGQEYRVSSVVEDTLETATGTINARNETTVSSRILATIERFPVNAGDSVHQGDVLLELDDRDLLSRVEQVSQTVRAAAALLHETRADHERISTLYEKQVASRADYDAIRAALHARQADYERSQGQLQEAKTLLSFTVIKSPIDGKVVERFAEPGDTVSPGMPLLRIYNPSLLRLDAQVRESLAARMSIGMQLSARIDALQREVPVLIDEIVPSADPGSRSITVKAILPDNDRLYPGMFGRLLIPTGSIERLYVPLAAIKRMGQLEFVEVVRDGHPGRRYVRTGQANERGQVEVLSGVQAGETLMLALPGGGEDRSQERLPAARATGNGAAD